MRAALAVSLLVVVVLGVFWALSGPDDDPARAPGKTPGRASRSSERQDDPKDPLAPTQPVPTDRFSTKPPAVDEGPFDTVAPGEPFLEVFVRDATTGAAVPGAVVVMTGLRKAIWDLGHQEENTPLKRTLSRSGRRYVSNEQGVARTHRLRESMFVAAFKDAVSAAIQCDAHQAEPVEIRLTTSHRLRVLVVDQSEQPRSGVPLVLMVGNLIRLRVRTGEDGIATFSGIEVAMASAGRGGERSGDVTFGFPVPTRVSVPFDPLAPPEEDPVRMTLPPTASVEVLVLGSDGKPFEGPTNVRVRAAREIPKRTSFGMVGPTMYDRRGSLPMRNGRRVFPFVGAGIALVVDVFPEEPFRRARKQLRALADGETRRVEVEVADRYPVLTGRVVDAYGAPMVSERFSLGVRRKEKSTGRDTGGGRALKTDAQGRFRFAFDVPWMKGDTRSISLQLSDRSSRIGGPVDLSRPLSPGDHDLGDIEVARHPLVFGGSVVDDKGRPLSYARVMARLSVKRGGAKGCTADAQGRFELRTETDAESGELDAMRDGYYCPEPVQAFVGARDLVLRMERAGSLHGSVVLSPGVARHEVRPFFLYTSEAGEERRTDHYLPVRGDGSFSLERLPPGTGTLSFGDREDVRIEGIVIVGGEENRDPRLQGIDLRDAWRSVEIHFVDEKGKTIEECWRVMGAGRTSFRGGRLRETVGPEGLTVTVMAEGYVPVDLVGIKENRTVTLRAAPVVDLLLTGIELPSPPFSMRARFTHITETGGRPRRFSESCEFDSTGRARTHLLPPGRYKLRVSVVRDPGNGRQQGARLRMIPLPEITVAEVATQTITIPVDPAALAKAMQEIAKARRR